MSKSKLKKEITKNLKSLDELVEKVRDTQIDYDEEKNWDYDYYSGLQSKLEAALEQLKNKTIPDQLDNFGDPVISEKGTLTLLTEWEEENNQDDDEE